MNSKCKNFVSELHGERFEFDDEWIVLLSSSGDHPFSDRRTLPEFT
jgi:hypothetical protein